MNLRLTAIAIVCVVLAGCSTEAPVTVDAGVDAGAQDMFVASDIGTDAADAFVVDANTADAADDATVADAGPSCAVACGANASCVEDESTLEYVCVCNPGFLGDGITCTDVASSLHGLRWELPCLGNNDGSACDAGDSSDTATIGGTVGEDYQITLHVRGVVEQRTYTGGTMSGYLAINSDAASCSTDPYNIYALGVSAPANTFYLNSGTSNIVRTWPIEYLVTFHANAGATLSLDAFSCDARQIINRDEAGTPVTVGEVDVTEPYDGQFIQVDVVSVELSDP